MKRQVHFYALGALLLVASEAAIAQTASTTTVLDAVKQSMLPAFTKLTEQAFIWLGAFAALQFIITNYKLLISDGDLQKALAKLGAAVAWIALCVYIITHGPDFIRAVGDEMFGVVGDMPMPSKIMANTLELAGIVAGLSLGVGALPLVGDTGGTILIIVMLAVLAVGLYFALKIFMLQLEVGLIAILSPMSFAFLGLDTLRDQGIAPFKSLLALAYRIILAGVILGAFGTVSSSLTESLKSVSVPIIVKDGLGAVLDPILAAIGAYLVLAFLLFKSDSVASSLAGGTASLGTNDVASAAAAGAAAGALVATGGASAFTGAGKAPQAMADFMSGLGGGGSIKNAGGMGGGGASPAPFVPAAPPSMSRTGASSGSSGTPGKSGPTSGTNISSKGQAGSAKPPAGSPKGGASNVASARYGSSPSDTADLWGAPKGASEAQLPSGANIQEPGAGNTSTATSFEPQTQSRGSADTASIGGAAPISPSLEQSMSQIAQHLGSQGPRKPTLTERMGEANRQIAIERAETRVSINSHQGD